MITLDLYPHINKRECYNMKKKASQVKTGEFIQIDDHLYKVLKTKSGPSGKHGHAKVRMFVQQFF